MAEKIDTWLGTVFGDQPVPHYEINTRTASILAQLAQSSEARCRETALLIEDLKQKTAEYQADGAHRQDVLLEGVGLSSESLSKSALNYVSALVDSAMVLGVRDTSLSSFMPAVNNLTNELLEAEKSHRTLERKLRALRGRLSDAMMLRNNLQEDLEKTAQSQSLEKVKAEEKLLSMDFISAKVKELNHRRETAEAHLASRNMDKSVTHQAIVELSKEIAALKLEIAPLKKKLEPYMDLSTNPTLVQVKIEEAKRELAAIDAQLEKNMDFK